MPYLKKDSDTRLKLICAASYMTSGIAGLIYMIVRGGGAGSPFFRFHFYQSILLGIFVMLLGWGTNAFVSISAGLLDMFGPALGTVKGILLTGINGFADLLHIVFLLATIAGVVQSLRSRYLELPVISALVRQNMR